MGAKAVLLTDGDGNQLLPITSAELIQFELCDLNDTEIEILDNDLSEE